MKKTIWLALLLISGLVFGEHIPKAKAIQMLQQVSSQDFPRSEAVFISNEIINLDEHCLGDIEEENYRKILTDKARKNNSVQFGYNTHYHQIEVKSIEIIKADGTVIPFEPGKILKEKDNTFTGGLNIYSNLSKIKNVELPDVQIGDIIYTRHIMTRKRAFMENHFFDFLAIEDDTAYLNKFKKIILPSRLPLYVHDLNNQGLPYDYQRDEAGNQVIHQWNVAKIPIIVPEPHIESYTLYAHHIILTTVKSWQEISRWYYGIVKPHLKINKAMKTKVRQLIKGAKSRREKLSRIFYWISNQVRYLGVDREKHLPGLEPHDVAYTFETRGGVCRDKAALLTAMFRIAGIRSDVILISAGSRLNFKAPVLWFNHAITVSYDENGNPEFIFDPTNENTRDFLPKYMEDNSYLIATAKGDTLRLTPVSPPEKNNSTLNIVLKRGQTNEVTGSMEFLFSGFADTVLRNHFANLTPYEIENTISSVVRLLHPHTRALDFQYSDYRDKTRNMRIFTRIEIPGYITHINQKIFIPFDAVKLKMHMLYHYIMGPFDQSSRKYDFKMEGAFSLDTRFEIDFARNLESPSFPVIKTINFLGFKTRLSSLSEEGRLKIEYHFETRKIHFRKEDFLSIKETINELFKNDDLYIIADSGSRE